MTYDPHEYKQAWLGGTKCVTCGHYEYSTHHGHDFARRVHDGYTCVCGLPLHCGLHWGARWRSAIEEELADR